MDYEIIGETLKFYNKEKNGDSFHHTFLEDENLLLVMVADGISQQPCDWLASDTACEQFPLFFKQSKLRDLSERIIESMNQTNQAIMDFEGDCSGMSSTFSLLVWDVTTNKARIANVGDSRIYRVRNNELKQLTEDDAVKRTKVIMTNNGRRTVDNSYLTQHFGATLNEVNVQEIETKSGDVLVLASDGYYERSILARHLLRLGASEDFEKEFKNIFKNQFALVKDDKTAVALKIY